mmetsp:Transcript_82700/g.233752  ORF Transcript_82700/g.233752 Transcript_82700/m.233752 type:complete len:135 (-) Transcript_82700:12-416(-)|eukprot:CAMPEP_0119524036 /NCGR_PEP_ID=MMETSP1344-20130328/39020_1 /TAXON_ID=236787 /ORGANISM="Florenciella parvula, Strain CCMP2471" /LENGTH=134 /DNA_ID=CAMNT_0007562443 /DNA_START=333 /DNA_END=737 /DNA_ORIENTATION=+
MATFVAHVTNPKTRHLWVAGAGLLVVGYAAKGAVWVVAQNQLVEQSEVDQKAAQEVMKQARAGANSAKYQIPKEYYEGLDLSKMANNTNTNTDTDTNTDSTATVATAGSKARPGPGAPGVVGGIAEGSAKAPCH